MFWKNLLPGEKKTLRLGFLPLINWSTWIKYICKLIFSFLIDALSFSSGSHCYHSNQFILSVTYLSFQDLVPVCMPINYNNILCYKLIDVQFHKIISNDDSLTRYSCSSVNFGLKFCAKNLINGTIKKLKCQRLCQIE